MTTSSSKTTLFHRLCQEQTLLAAWQLVKSKNAAGGLDGVSVAQYNENIGEHLAAIVSELRQGSWTPQPYLRVEIPKKNSEKRKLGLLTIKDKIIQQAILTLISPQFDRLFVNNSYGYRPQKGPVRAIHRTHNLCQMKKTQWVLRLDIDNYFDTIDHTILFQRLQPYVKDDEILRLIQLCVSMGNVTHKGHWVESSMGVPQGAILSPLLSNFYLHPFDQFILSRTPHYVRYADDFVVLLPSEEDAKQLLEQIISFLDTRLKLKLNEPLLLPKKEPFEFLGIQFLNGDIGLSGDKLNDLTERISTFHLDGTGNMSKESAKSYSGIKNYYGQLLPQPTLELLDTVLLNTLKQLVSTNHRQIPNKSFLIQWLAGIEFLSTDRLLHRKALQQEIVDTYLQAKGAKAVEEGKAKNQRIVAQRKIEYHRKEAEGAELIVNTPGAYVGMSGGTIVVRNKKEQLAKHPVGTLRHLTILSRGVSLSSNAISLCMENKIPIDFFDTKGKLTASILTPKYMDATHWLSQATLPEERRFPLAQKILYGKIKNQSNLIKYFGKYHDKNQPYLSESGIMATERLAALSNSIKQQVFSNNYRETLMAIESQAAVTYWEYIRVLLHDDGVDFDHREHQGATDLFNSLLNYGYALLYARVWQALLAARLNPTESVIHVKQAGKPTLVYDVVELFRAQAVDRIAVSMVQKHLPLEICNGKLSDNTRALLAKNILERFNRYEKYRGTEMQFHQVILRQAHEIAEFIENNTTYRPYISKW